MWVYIVNCSLAADASNSQTGRLLPAMVMTIPPVIIMAAITRRTLRLSFKKRTPPIPARIGTESWAIDATVVVILRRLILIHLD